MAGLTVTIFIVTLAVFAWVAWGLSRVRSVAALPDALPERPPRVSIIVAALNEEATIEPALRSLLALDYPDLEIIAVNDRSTDATGAILDRVAATDSRLRVLHISTLPPGWLGKNHALHVAAAAAAASGDLLLFSDADVVFERRALRQTVAYFVANDLDHLTLMPDMLARSLMAGAMVCAAGIFLFLRHPLWMLRRWKRAYFGAGAFNMVRASKYRAWGGHEPVKLEVLDDLMLGRFIKHLGLRQDALVGKGSVMVEWYADAPAMVKGLEKNGFASMEYSVGRLAAGSAAMLVGRYWPYIGLFVTSGRLWWINAATIAIDFAAHVIVLRVTSLRLRALVWWPLDSAVMVFTMWRSAAITLHRGGVTWRGTLYPLDALRRAHGAAMKTPRTLADTETAVTPP